MHSLHLQVQWYKIFAILSWNSSKDAMAKMSTITPGDEIFEFESQVATQPPKTVNLSLVLQQTPSSTLYNNWLYSLYSNLSLKCKIQTAQWGCQTYSI